jgi:hypothetical protein
VLVDERAEARIPRPPLPYGRARRAHMTQPLEFGVHPPTKASHAGIYTLCQSLGCADQMCSTALPQACPGLLDSIAITDQDPSPVANELYKRCFGAGGMDLKVGHARIGHDP